MNSSSKILDYASEKISFALIQKYLSNRNWVKKQSKREHIAIFFREHPTPIEIILPLSREFIDYKDLIKHTIQKISIAENRDTDLVINDLLLPPSDVLRFRAANKRTEMGLITIDEGFALLENAKKSLFAAACDIVHPTLYHKRMSYKSAQQFINSCFLGQTERGSFVASIVCPFINETADDEPTQLSLFNSEEDLSTSLTRNVTKHYMQSLNKLKTNIENGNHDVFQDLEQDIVISANFIESILELGEYGDNEEIEISSSWSTSTTEVNEVPKSISFTKDYISPMQSIITKMKPRDEGQNGSFIGKVSKAAAEPDPASRSEGEILFNFIGEDDKIVKAKVSLNNTDFSIALDALDKGLHVKISGLLKTSGKTKVIENPTFELL